MTTTSTNQPRQQSGVSSFQSSSETPNRSGARDRLTDPALWERIRTFAFDEPGTSLTFARRLARENGWNAERARRVIDEYRRFVYLAMVSPNMVSPSEDVDQAWHLHMVYTRSYWDDLCAKVLGRPLHHGPTRGGTREQTKFVDLYERTKVLYQAEFGHRPPADLWPSSEQRFGEDLSWRRVNTREHWVIRKPRWDRLWRSSHTRGASAVGMVAAGAILVGLVLGGCAAMGLSTGQVMPQVTQGVLLIIAGLVLMLVLLAIAAAIGRALSRRSSTARARVRQRRNGSGDSGDVGYTYWPFLWWGGDSSSSREDDRHGVDADVSGTGDSGSSDGGSDAGGGDSGGGGDAGGDSGGGGGGCGGGGCGGGGGD